MNKKNDQSKRNCPGEQYEITEAICRARQANSYPKCLLCSHFSGSEDEFSSGDPKIKKNIFRASGIVGECPDEINEYVMRKVGCAAGQFLRARPGANSPAVIACDRRENSRNLSRIFGEGMESAGLHALHLGPALPDMLRFAMKDQKLSGGVFISGCTASSEVNGIRIIDGDGRPLVFESGIEKIGLIARRMKPGRSHSHGKNETMRVLPDYRNFILGLTSEIQPLTVVVDGSSGIGGEIIPYVLGKTPLNTIKSHCEPDGQSELLGLRFPAGEVNTDVQQAIRSKGAHLGIAVDYDGDRCVFYDEEGRALRSDIAAAIIAREVLERKPEARIGYDLRSTAALREEVLMAGGQPLRTSPSPGRINEAVIGKKAQYAFDLTGRHCFREFQGGESPVMALLMLCSAISRGQMSLSELAGKVRRYAYSGIEDHQMPSPEKAEAAMEALLEAFPDCEKDRFDGITFRFPTWWFHVKLQSDSRIIKLCVEGRGEEEERKGRHAVEEIIREHQ